MKAAQKALNDFNDVLKRFEVDRNTENLELHISNIIEYKCDEIELRVESLRIYVDQCEEKLIEKTEVYVEKLREMNQKYVDRLTKVETMVKDIKNFDEMVKYKKKLDKMNKLSQKIDFKVQTYVFVLNENLPSATNIGKLPDHIRETQEEFLKNMEKARKDLSKQLDKKSLFELKSYRKPPKLVELAGQGVCLTFNREPTWVNFRKFAASPDFLHKIMDVNPELINETNIEKLKILLKNEDMNPYYLIKISKSCPFICKWLREVLGFYNMKKTIQIYTS